MTTLNVKQLHRVLTYGTIQWRIQDLTLGGVDFVNRGGGSAGCAFPGSVCAIERLNCLEKYTHKI